MTPSFHLSFPPHNDFPIEASLRAWTKQPSAKVEQGEAVAKITIGGIPYELCVSLPCILSSQVARLGRSIKTGEILAICEPGPENFAPDGGRGSYSFIRPA